MPLVHIDLIEGRTDEQLKALVKDVTAAISKDANVPAELDESTVTIAEVAAKVQEREGRLAELKTRTDERNASAQGQAGFPAAAAAAAAARGAGLLALGQQLLQDSR